MKIRYCLQFACQILVIVWGKIFFGTTTTIDIGGLPQQFVRRSYLVIANHRRGTDPFVICAVLPWRIILKTLPIGFMTHNVFYDSPLRPFMWLMGCYPAKNPKGKHKIFGVDGAAQLLSHGFSISIFPEGRRVRHEQRGEAKQGVIRIHQAAPTVPFILAHIEYNHGVKAWLTGRRRVITYKLVSNPSYDNPEIIMDEIFAL